MQPCAPREGGGAQDAEALAVGALVTDAVYLETLKLDATMAHGSLLAVAARPPY